MPRPRYENVDADKKQKLLAAAVKEFAAHGFELASINTILDDAGFSKGSFYYYFDDKTDLAATVFLEIGKPMFKLSDPGPVTTPDGFWAELRRLSLERLREIESKSETYACLLRLSNAFLTHPEMAAKVLPHFAPMRQKMAGFLERGVAIGALRSDLPIGTLMAMIEALKRSLYQSLYPGDPVLTEAQLESFTDLVMDLAQRIGARRDTEGVPERATPGTGARS